MLKGLRLRKIVPIIPGLLKINFSKSGASLSVGKRGFTQNFNRHGTRTTVGIPGSGVSYSKYKKYDDVVPDKEQVQQTNEAVTTRTGINLGQWVIIALILVLIAVLVITR